MKHELTLQLQAVGPTGASFTIAEIDCRLSIGFTSWSNREDWEVEAIEVPDLDHKSAWRPLDAGSMLYDYLREIILRSDHRQNIDFAWMDWLAENYNGESAAMAREAKSNRLTSRELL